MNVNLPPLVPPTFESRVNPYTGRCSGKLWDWLEGFISTDARSWNRMKVASPDLASAYAWPDASPDALTEGMKWMCFYFLIDDELERLTSTGRYVDLRHSQRRFQLILQGFFAKVVAPTAIECEFAKLWEQSSSVHPSRWMEELTQSISRWIESFSPAGEFDASALLSSLDLHRYEEFREVSYGADWIYLFSEASRGEYLAPTLRDLPQMASLRKSTSLQISLTNDLFSAGREFSEGHYLNSIFIVMSQECVDFRKAATLMQERVGFWLQNFIEARSLLFSRLPDLGVSGENELILRRYVKGLEQVVSGNFNYHCLVRRNECSY
ncbi:terpene synthase family protein [Streptomyces virginiae]|uniref:terpene synthase family protein n=1 Tax=Streptomyces virginiae TaxID=1961 RepID=UPI000AE2EC2C|nr:hypothetical protein [Streptomyces virginiae]